MTIGLFSTGGSMTIGLFSTGGSMAIGLSSTGGSMAIELTRGNLPNVIGLHAKLTPVTQI